MKYFLLAFVALSLLSCTSTIYIVRHAEKSTEPKNDPHLTADGNKRAQDLMELLKNKHIKTIYSTNTNRTKETATPLSEKNHATIQLYKNDTTKKLLQSIFLSKKNTLIVGHSNTIIPMLDSMQLTHTIKTIPDNEYDNLFIVKVKKYCWDCAKPFKAKLKENKYGAAATDINSAPKTMQ